MVGSIWSGNNPFADYSLYMNRGKGAQEESAPSALEAACPIAAARNPSIVAEAEESTGLNLNGNNVNASVVASQLAAGENAASPAAPAASGGGSGGGAEEEDETVTIYKTIVLPDGSKLLQIITKKPDGSMSTTTTKLPGTGKEQGDSEKKIVGTMPNDEDETDSIGAAAAGMMEKSAGLQED